MSVETTGTDPSPKEHKRPVAAKAPEEAPKTKEAEKTVLKPKPRSYRVEETKPSDIVDVWRLYEQSLKLAPPKYPVMEEETPDHIRANLYNIIANPQFMGFIARHGRKPVGQIFGMVMQRPFGAPKIYLQVIVFWVDHEHRKSKLGQQLLKTLFAKAKLNGIHSYESLTDLHLVEGFLKFTGGKGSVVSSRIAGKIVME